MTDAANSAVKHFHAHDVLRMISEQNRALALFEIKALILEKFGSNAQFGSCSMGGMDADQIIEFLFERQKLFEAEPGKYALNMHNSCGH